jgi:hypothetical protein
MNQEQEAPLIPHDQKPSEILQHFHSNDVHPYCKEVSELICLIAKNIDSALPNSEAKNRGLGRLLEAKDWFVRAANQSATI